MTARTGANPRRLTGWVLASCVLTTTAATVNADELALGDAAYARFELGEALAHYCEAVQVAPGSVAALWKAARATVDVGRSVEERDEREAKRLYRDAEQLARRAVEADPGSADAYFALAMSLGRLALVEGAKTRIRLSKEVRAAAERALELDPGHDGAHHILGRWHFSISKLSWLLRAFAKMIYGGVPPGASMARAAEHFARAVELDPSRPVHHLEYARTLAELKRYSEARQQLRLCIELPRVQWDDPQNEQEATELLEEIRGEKDPRS